ncbi:MAG: inorganic pyrophosphatase [Spirosomataceae bacterium]
MKPVYKSHPWHGIPMGEKAPEVVNVFIEIVPTDTVKYEIDKETGYLKIDRPQKYSNVVPALYGFVPQTYCGEEVAKLAREKSGRDIKEGDGDPLDILVLTEHAIPHGDLILKAVPIGGLCLLDKGEADDKIIAVLVGDLIYQHYKDIKELPESIVTRLKHYFLTYKNLPDEPNTCEIAYIYGKEEAHDVIRKSMSDYRDLIFKPI